MSKTDTQADNYLMKRAIFPGFFDPFTVGHYSIVQRGLHLFDEIIIAIGINSQKEAFLPIETRLQNIRKIVENEPRIKVMPYEGLTVDFAKKTNAAFILRGIRSVADFEYEKIVADVNRALSGIETITLFCENKYSFVSSSMVRELLRAEKDASQYLP